MVVTSLSTSSVSWLRLFLVFRVFSLISSMRKLFWCPFTRFYLACAMRPPSLLSSINETLHGRPLSIYSLVSINVLKFTHQSLELFSVNEWLRPLIYRVVCCPFLLVFKSPRVLHTLFCVYPNCAFISETPHQMLQLVCNASHFPSGEGSAPGRDIQRLWVACLLSFFSLYFYLPLFALLCLVSLWSIFVEGFAFFSLRFEV